MISLIKEWLEKVRIVEKMLEDDLEFTRMRMPNVFSTFEEVKLLAPIPRTRKNIIYLGLNYDDPTEETNTPVPKNPFSSLNLRPQ